MPVSLGLIWLVITGVIALLLCRKKFANNGGFPLAGALLILGFVGSELATFNDADIGLRWYHFRDIVFYGLVPALVLNTAFQLDTKIFRSQVGLIFLLTIPVGIFTACIIAAFVFSGINHPTGFPILVALLLGGILTANEPEHLLDRLPADSVSSRFSTLLKGESMFNDVIAVMLFSLLIEIILMHDSLPNIGFLLWQPLWLLVGGFGLGVLLALLVRPVLARISGGKAVSVVLIIAAYGLYLLSDKFISVSGVASVVAFGLVTKGAININDKRVINGLAKIAYASLYLLVGISFTLEQFPDRWIAILLAAAGLILGRVLGSYVFLAINRVCRPISIELSNYEKLGIALSGTPGAIALALALSLPLDLPAWYTVQSAVYGVVAIGIFIQIPIAAAVLSKLR